MLLAACSPFQSPQRVDPGQSGAQPSPSSSKPPEPQRVPAARQWHEGDFQYGLQTYVHRVGSGPADRNTAEILDYVIGLGANSIAFSFPIYTDGVRPTKVYAGKETPSPQELERMVTEAKKRGLRVMVRPLIDEANLKTTPGGWRGSIHPPDVAGWFGSYQKALKPFLAASARGKADEFVLATELSSLQNQRTKWRTVDTHAARLFPGTLSFTFNWDAMDKKKARLGDELGLDLYFAVHLGDSASVEQLTNALEDVLAAKPKSLRANMVVQEVGIAAQSGMYRHPWFWGDEARGPIKPKIQANWFTAACRAVKHADLDGLYYWMVDGNSDPSAIDPAKQPPAGFVGRPAEASIKACFSED